MPTLPAVWTPGACAAARTIWIGCGCAGAAWPWVEQPSKAMGSAQLSSSAGSGGDGHGLRLLAGQVEQRASTLA
jgi:hypothetical protein